MYVCRKKQFFSFLWILQVGEGGTGYWLLGKTLGDPGQHKLDPGLCPRELTRTYMSH